MPNIRPVSDLRKYKKVLDDVSYGSPVYLTKNGRGYYAIVSMKEMDELNAMKTLIHELAKGEESAKKGWISLDDVEKRLKIMTTIEHGIQTQTDYTEDLQKDTYSEYEETAPHSIDSNGAHTAMSRLQQG